MLTEFIHCLHRVAKIGNYYPSGHAIVDQAAEAFLVSLGKIAQANSSVLLEIHEDCLVVDGIKVETNTKSKTELLNILQQAAIGSITISRHASIEDTLEFVRLILVHRAKIKNSSDFSIADLSTMPESFKVRDKQFLVDKTTVIHSESEQNTENTMNQLLEALEAQGLSKTQTEQCRTLLNTLHQSYQPVSTPDSMVKFTWNDVQSLLLNVIQGNPDQTGDQGYNRVQNDINTLITIFGHLEASTDDKKSRDSLGLLISLVKTKPRPINSKQTSRIQKRDADRAPELSIEEIQNFVSKRALPPAILKKIAKTDSAEEISILLQLLHHDQTHEAVRNINRFFHDIFQKPLTKNEHTALIEGCRQFFTLNLKSRLERVIPPLVLIIRQAANVSSLEFLNQLSKDLSKEQLQLLWSVIVNELLAVGMGEKAKVYMHLMLTCSQLSLQEMGQQREPLELLDCFQKNRTAAALFPGWQRQTNLLFCFLLTTSLKKTIYQAILPVLKKTPPDPLALAVFPFLSSDENHLQFLQLYFSNNDQLLLTPGIKKLAGNILLAGLSHLSEDQMEEHWVPQAILYCGQTPVDGMKELLERIVSEKKMLIMSLWPQLSRQAAQKALKELNRTVKR